jgi:hypothetical protein
MSVATPTKTKAKPQSKAKVTPKRVEANRRNSQKSTGPRTAEGKEASKFNALTHGKTARSALLPGEDSAELVARQRALRDDMQPRNALEAELLDRVGAHMFRSERAELSGDAQASNRIRHEAREQDKSEAAEALKLGESLLWKPSLPLPVDASHRWTLDEPPMADDDLHPQHPGRLLLRLEWTVAGCDWLLDRWAELMRRLNVEGPSRPADAFRMIRLTGKHAIDMEDDYDVARVILCTLALTVAPKGEPPSEPFDWVSALIVMLYSVNREGSIKTVADVARFTYSRAFEHRLAELPLATLAPEGVSQARQWLTGVIEGQLKRVNEIRAELAQIAAADAAEAPARLSYEIGPEGDKHRRYILSNERLVNRTVNDFCKARNMSESGVFDCVDAERTNANAPAGAVVEPRNNAADMDHPATCENHREEAIEEAIPADDCRETLVANLDQEPSCDDDDNLRNEANEAGENVPTEIDAEPPPDSIWDAVARQAPIGAENLRKLNEECRTEEQEDEAAARRIRAAALEYMMSYRKMRSADSYLLPNANEPAFGGIDADERIE